MGGRGQIISSGGFSTYKYEAEKDSEGKNVTINRYKVIRMIDDPHKGLPEYSNTPNTIYFRRDDKGNISQFKVYDASRRSHVSVEWAHSHDGIPNGTAHIHKYKVGKDGNSVRSNKGVLLSKYYIKKYGKLINSANPDVKFR